MLQKNARALVKTGTLLSSKNTLKEYPGYLFVCVICCCLSSSVVLYLSYTVNDLPVNTGHTREATGTDNNHEKPRAQREAT